MDWPHGSLLTYIQPLFKVVKPLLRAAIVKAKGVEYFYKEEYGLANIISIIARSWREGILRA